MPKMVLNRNHTLRTTTPFSVQFVKGVATEVHPAIVHLALSIGAVMEDGSDGVPEVKETDAPAAPVGEARSKVLADMFEQFALRNQRGDFTASGLPDLRRLQAALGFDVDRKELIVEWDKYIASKDAE